MEILEKVDIKRILYSQQNKPKGTTLVCFVCIHGNEPAGILGLKRIIEVLETKQISLNGNFYVLLGNINAYKNKIRFQDIDLNRLWSTENIRKLKNRDTLVLEEEKEQLMLYNNLNKILNSNSGPFVFVDLHTTSSPTNPFITISDSINNRKLASKFNIPIVLGIEEYLNGPLLTYINEFGHISLGFEAGQHDSEISIDSCEAFIWLMLKELGLINKSTVDLNIYKAYFKNFSDSTSDFFEIIYRYELQSNSKFKMVNGFKNFDKVIKHEVLAHDNNTVIKAPEDGFTFMPLYQEQGDDGFFIVRRISKFWLALSMLFRKLKLHNLLRLLPGIKQDPNDKYCLIVNKGVAQLLATDIFHLFGYRKKVVKGNKMHFIKRDRKIKAFY